MAKVLRFLSVLICGAALMGSAAEKKIVLIAGGPSHGPGDHEHRAGCLLFKSCLDHVPGVTAVVCSNGWPTDPAGTFKDAATVVIYSDGEGRHPIVQSNHMGVIADLMQKGVGLVCIHYATEPAVPRGQQELLAWIGGYFEANYSVNPHWKPTFNELPKHPVTRGVKTPVAEDEWYFHIRLSDAVSRRTALVSPDQKGAEKLMQFGRSPAAVMRPGLTRILSAVPPESTMKRKDGPHEGNASVREAVRKGEAQTVAWAFERADGGRGFGYTGGHFHKNWANDDLRKLMLNAILWTAKVEVPKDGVGCELGAGQIGENLDRK